MISSPQRITIVFITILIMGCSPKEGSDTSMPISPSDNDAFSVSTSAHFTVEFHEDYKVVKVINPWKSANRTFTYLLVQKGAKPPTHIKADEVIRIPLDNIVCFSTSHIPLLEYIGEEDKLIGFPNTGYISSPKVRERIDHGKIVDLGSEMDVNVETLIGLKPAMIMAFGMGEFTNQFNIIKRSGIPVVYNADYIEKDPLGRAEWIKFMSLFFNKEVVADSIFQAIVDNYDSLKDLTKAIEHRPTVFSGILYGDAWFMPGGKNYASRFFEDAGANYLWNDNSEGSYLKLSFENVYEKAHSADYWIGVGSYETFTEMEKTDKRYALFDAFKNRQIYNFNLKVGPSGGNEYFELGYLRPDLILADLIKVFHGDKLPEYSFYFHKKLQ